MKNESLTTLRVTCIDAGECTVFFEPEGGSLQLVAGEVLTVEIRDALPTDSLEVGYTPKGIIISALSGEIFAKKQDGKLLYPVEPVRR